MFCKGCDCWGLEKHSQFKPYPKSLFDARSGLCREQRMAPETEKVIVYSNLLYSKDLRKNLTEFRFDVIARRDEGVSLSRWWLLPKRQRIIVDLSIGSKRQPAQDQEMGRYHIIRKFRG